MSKVTQELPRDFLIRKCGYWYRPNAQGYTPNPAEAGRFTFSEAWEYSHPNGPDGPRDGISFVHESEVLPPPASVTQEDLVRKIFEAGHADGWRGNQMRRDAQHVDAEKGWRLYAKSTAALELCNMAHTLAEREVELDWWRGAATALAEREAEYRRAHDLHGDGSAQAGRAWDLMRRQGDRIRAALGSDRNG